jgi:hypothetical protein
MVLPSSHHSQLEPSIIPAWLSNVHHMSPVKLQAMRKSEIHLVLLWKPSKSEVNGATASPAKLLPHRRLQFLLFDPSSPFEILWAHLSAHSYDLGKSNPRRTRQKSWEVSKKPIRCDRVALNSSISEYTCGNCLCSRFPSNTSRDWCRYASHI